MPGPGAIGAVVYNVAFHDELVGVGVEGVNEGLGFGKVKATLAGVVRKVCRIVPGVIVVRWGNSVILHESVLFPIQLKRLR